MQKKVVALAVAAIGMVSAPVMAQSNVTISGTVMTGLHLYKVGDANRQVDTERRVSDQSSRIIFSGQEKIGSDLSAWFQIDSRFSTDLGAAGSGTALAAGNTGVGLMGNWGKMTLGRWDLHYWEYTINGIEAYKSVNLGAYAGMGIMSAVGAQGITPRSRTNNVVKYDSPTFGGFSGVVAYSTNPNGNEGVADGTNRYSEGGAWSAAGRYASGPIRGFVSYWHSKIEGRPTAPIALATADQSSLRLGVAYTLPMGLKVGLGWDKSKLKNVGAAGAQGDVSRSGWMVPVSYNLGANNFFLTYARVGNLSNTSNTGANTWTLGYGYDLSKRTSVGLYVTKLSNKSGGTYSPFVSGSTLSGSLLQAGESATQVYAGIQHAF